MEAVDVKTLELEVQRYITSVLIDECEFSMDPSQIKVAMEYRGEHMAYQLSAVMAVPGKRLPRLVIAEYPASLWQYIRKTLGLSHDTVKVWRDEVVLFPDIAIPPELAARGRVSIHYTTELPAYAVKDHYDVD